jgi:hypothetical protein
MSSGLFTKTANIQSKKSKKACQSKTDRPFYIDYNSVKLKRFAL